MCLFCIAGNFIIQKGIGIMKKFIKAISAAAAVVLGSLLMTVTAFAEDYEFDVSDAVMTDGGWGQSYIHYTACEGSAEHLDNFNPTWLTKESVIKVEFEYDGNPVGDSEPLQLIWQTWDNGPAGADPNVNGTWNVVRPFECGTNFASFSYSDIVSAYGTSDFKTVYAVCVGDAGVKLKVTRMTATNCNITDPSETAAEDSVEETSAALITTAPSVAANAPTEGNAGSMVLIIVVAAVVVAAVAVVVVMLIKKAKNSYY